MNRKIMSVSMLAMVIGLSLTVTAEAGKLYKWRDENGKLHYSDSLPPEEVKKARDELNDKGISVERVERAMTDEEIAAQSEERKKAAELARIQKAKDKADNLLLNAFASEEDITRRRQQRLEGLRRTVEVTEATVASQRRNLAELINEAADLERNGKEVNKALKGSIDSLRRQITKQEEYIVRKTGELDMVNEEHDKLLERYRQIGQQPRNH